MVALGELCCGVVGAGVLAGVVAAGAGLLDGVVGVGLLDGVVAAGASDRSGPCTSAAFVDEMWSKKKDGAKRSAARSTSGNRLFIHVYL